MNPAPPATSPNPNREPPRADPRSAAPSAEPRSGGRAAEADRRGSARGDQRAPAARIGASERHPRGGRARAEPPAPPGHARSRISRRIRAGVRGRRHAEDDRADRGPRDAFQRDRDRIIHSIPFRRLRHKTQVFVAPDGDHYRVRLTHSLEVAQIARTMARALGLNEDLTEALCLAHDIGHPPFGHAGEDALQAAMAEAGGFDHNAHTHPAADPAGEAPIRASTGSISAGRRWRGSPSTTARSRAPPWALAEADAEWPLELGSWPGLEAQVAAIADDIAYDNHDIDDGLRGGLFTLEELLAVPLARRGLGGGAARAIPASAEARLVPELVRDLIGAMVNDVLAETRAARRRGRRHRSRRSAPPAARSPASRPRWRPRSGRSRPSSTPACTTRPRSRRSAPKRSAMLAALFAAYRADPGLLPARMAPEGAAKPARLRAIGDFIAGMTDRYAVRRYEELIGPTRLPGRF